MDRAMAAGAQHNEVRNLGHPALFRLGQRDTMMGLDHFDAVDLERLDATGLAEEFTAVGLGKSGLGVTR